MRPTGAGKTRVVFHAPARGLIGYHGEYLTDTRGTGVMNRMFLEYAPHKGNVGGRINGVLISTETGEAVAYGLWYIEERGKLFITSGAKVYEGMIIGQHAKDNDLDVNPTKAKQLTNIRTTSKDEAVRLTPIVPMTLEQAMAYIQDDELVEVTPLNIRLRKRELLPHLREPDALGARLHRAARGRRRQARGQAALGQGQAAQEIAPGEASSRLLRAAWVDADSGSACL
jgi:GTP-binding protein